MRFAGKVSEFNRITGRGLISSKAAGGKFHFDKSQVQPGISKIDAGDQVEFEVGFVAGESRALSISLAPKMTASQQVQIKAQLGKPIGEDQVDFAGVKAAFRRAKSEQEAAAIARQSPPSSQVPVASEPKAKPRRTPDDKERCGHCSKYMVPRLATFKGKPERSFCPFCGGVYRDFAVAEPANLTLAGAVGSSVVGALLASFISF